MLPLGRVLAIGAVLIPVSSIACATEVAANKDENGAETAEALSNKSALLKYEGTCEFLRSCSKWSRGFPEGNVVWGCNAENTIESGSDEYGPCEDDDLWVAGPTHAYCGKTVRVCNGSVCVDAKVKDVSVSQDWEASNGVLGALGLPYGLTGRCRGFGGGKVTISTE
jgi:hypothetical protein